MESETYIREYATLRMRYLARVIDIGHMHITASLITELGESTGVAQECGGSPGIAPSHEMCIFAQTFNSL